MVSAFAVDIVKAKVLIANTKIRVTAVADSLFSLLFKICFNILLPLSLFWNKIIYHVNLVINSSRLCAYQTIF